LNVAEFVKQLYCACSILINCCCPLLDLDVFNNNRSEKDIPFI